MLLHLLLLLSSLSSRVAASNAAAPFEALAFYYAHKLEYLAAAGTGDPEQNRFLAHNCTRRWRRVCTFQEFLDYVYGHAGGSLGGYGNDGSFDPEDRTRYPNGGTTPEEMARMADDLAREGFTSASFSPPELFAESARVENYDYMLSGVSDRVEWAMAELGNGVDDNADLKAARQGLTGILGERIADDFPDSIPGIKDEIKKATGLDVEINEDTRSPSGRKYPSIDWFKTAEKMRTAGLSPDAVKKNIDKIVTVLNNYQNARTDHHYKNIVAVEASLDRTLPPQQDRAGC